MRNELARVFSKLVKAFLEGRDLLRLWRCGQIIDVKGGEKKRRGLQCYTAAMVRSVSGGANRENIAKAQQARTAKVKMEGAVPR